MRNLAVKAYAEPMVPPSGRVAGEKAEAFLRHVLANIYVLRAKVVRYERDFSMGISGRRQSLLVMLSEQLREDIGRIAHQLRRLGANPESTYQSAFWSASVKDRLDAPAPAQPREVLRDILDGYETIATELSDMRLAIRQNCGKDSCELLLILARRYEETTWLITANLE